LPELRSWVCYFVKERSGYMSIARGMVGGNDTARAFGTVLGGGLGMVA
jgi:hypothetical protein